MTRSPIDRAASVAARLRNVAAGRGTDLELIFRRYAVERLLYRLSLSAERDRFILKGAMLFTAWLADPFRPTRDVDLLGLGEAVAPIMATTFRAVCEQPVENDGLVFDTGTIDAQPIRGQLEDGGVRIKLTARLGRSRIPVQIDIGFGDAVTPAAVEIEFPPLLDGPAPRIMSYPKETVVAEKLHAIVALGQVNTRLKDYYDLVALARLFAFDGEPLVAAIAATFAARDTALPATLPVGLGAGFAEDPQKTSSWQAFARREPLLVATGDLAGVVAEIAAFVMPPLQAARASAAFRNSWRPGGPWQGRRRRGTRKAG